MAEAALQPAYALHSRRYRESSLIVEFITQDYGRVALTAKGALGTKHPRQQLLQPFSPLLLAWRGKGDLPILTSVEAARVLPQITGRTLYCGLYVNELVLKLTERNDPHSELFFAYSACMQDLIETKGNNADLEKTLRRFEVRLLNELGLGMLLDIDQQGLAIDPSAHYHYDFDAGPVIARQDENSVAGETLIALVSGEFSSQQQRLDARKLMRRVLDHHLGGRRLRSRELFKAASPTQYR